jgi:hypothetical protein
LFALDVLNTKFRVTGRAQDYRRTQAEHLIAGLNEGWSSFLETSVPRRRRSDVLNELGHSAGPLFGISGVSVTGAEVVVNSHGPLGVISSSRRYKEQIEPMGDRSTNLNRLRPVTFRYKQPDEKGEKPLQCGLVAEFATYE